MVRSSFRALAVRIVLLLLAQPLHPLLVRGIDNGLGVTPPQGWRSWNAYTCTDSSPTRFRGGNILTDKAMLRAMDAVTDRSRKVNNVPTSLKELGFSWVSMDDGWQQCNCSTRQAIDPLLPNCSISDCRTGYCSWHNTEGRPLVNSRRFPHGMKALVDRGHSLGLKVGTYLNNCICMEAKSQPQYEQDVDWMLSMGFDGVKIDNCGSSHNVSYYAELFNRSGRPIRIEDCHTTPNHPHFEKDGSIDCPMNMYRSGGDIAPNFNSVLGEIYSTVPYSDRSVPLSRPGCWAYPDMMQVGNFRGVEPTRSHEERSHFGLWCVVSSPLILGFDMGNEQDMDRVWPTITNADALAVNQEWAGHPGTLVKAYPECGSSGQKMTAQAPCPPSVDGQGWHFDGPRLVSPDGFCLDGSHGSVDCPPATTRSSGSQCGHTLVNCSAAQGHWSLNATSGALQWRESSDAADAQCLSALPCVSAADRDQNGKGPQSAQVLLSRCPAPGQPLPKNSVFELGDGKLRAAGVSACLVSAPRPGVQLWAKPLARQTVAALVLNPLESPQSLEVPLADVPGHPCDSEGCQVRDVWTQRDLPIVHSSLSVDLAPHESAFFILSAAGSQRQFIAVV